MSPPCAPEPTSSRSDLAAELRSAVQSVGETLPADQLAFLAATRKFEEPVRDLIAWRLHQRLAPGLIVSREFPVGPKVRADLAILQGATPVAVVELKALYAFDIHSEPSRNKYRGMVAADLERTALHVASADAYAIALTTHVNGDIPAALLKVVKYAPGIRRANAKYSDAEQLRADAIPIWRAEMEGLGAPVEHITLGSGTTWTLQVTVDAWLIGPVAHATLATPTP
jgi:hypothetical protein